MRSLRLLLPCALALLAAAVLATPASAAMPAPKSVYAVHNHGDEGKDWHVEIEVSRDGKRIKGAVLFLEECGETIFGENIAIRPDGSWSASGATRKGKVRWTMDGLFEEGHVHGFYEITAPKCATGRMPYDAHDTAGGAHDHANAMVIGNQAEYPPAMASADPNVRRARKLRMRSLKTMWQYDTIDEAQARGYVFTYPTLDDVPCPGTHHMRKHDAAMWGKFLNPNKPQSLVWWCDGARNFHLAAYMFRAAKGKPPTTFGNLLQWHRHGPRGTWMTHLWLVPDTQAALATCAPFKAFERFGRFRYEPYREDILLDAPCSDTPGFTAAG